MPRNQELFCCGTCFFSHNPSTIEDYEYWECQFEAYKAVTESGESANLPRVHKDNCICKNWMHSNSLATLPSN
jgi:hypothetical protein